MKTLKLDIINDFNAIKYMREYSNAIRIAFNRFQDKFSEKDVYNHLRNTLHINCWMAASAVKGSLGIYELHGNKKIVFGGKYMVVFLLILSPDFFQNLHYERNR